MNRKHDHEELAEQLRRDLISAGAEPRDLTPLPGQTQRAESALADIVTMPRDAQATPLPVRRAPSRTRKLVRAGGFVAAAAVLALVFVIVRPGQSPEPAAAGTPPLLRFEDVKPGTLPAAGKPAAAALEKLAAKAETLPASAGPVQRVVLDSWWASTETSDTAPARSALVPVQRESYFQPDGTIRAIERRGAPLDQNGRIDPSLDSLRGPVQSDDSFESPDPGPNYAETLPTNAATLRTTLEARQDPVTCAEASGGCLVNDVVDLYHNYVLPPRLAAALWEVMSTDPSITYLGPTHDRLGRDAIAFTTPGVDGTSQSLVFVNPKTGAYLGDEVVLTKTSDAFSFTPPAVVSFSALVIADRIEEDQLPPE